MDTQLNETIIKSMLDVDEDILENITFYNMNESQIDPYNTLEASLSYGYIYEIINTINGKTYIGCRMIKRDNGKWDKYYGSGKAIKIAITKYGKENFIKNLVCYAPDEETLFKIEYAIIRNRKRSGNGAQYNIFNGSGAGGNTFKDLKEQQLEEIRKKQSIGIKKAIADGKIVKKKLFDLNEKNSEIWDKHRIEIIKEYNEIGYVIPPS